MKFFFSLILVFCCATSLFAQTEIVVGDMNNDGKITIADISILAETALGKIPKRTISINQTAKEINSFGVSLSEGTANINNGTYTLPITITYGGNQVVQISSSDESVATVSGNVVTMNKAGKVTFTASIKDEYQSKYKFASGANKTFTLTITQDMSMTWGYIGCWIDEWGIFEEKDILKGLLSKRKIPNDNIVTTFSNKSALMAYNSFADKFGYNEYSLWWFMIPTSESIQKLFENNKSDITKLKTYVVYNKDVYSNSELAEEDLNGDDKYVINGCNVYVSDKADTGLLTKGCTLEVTIQ